MRSKARKKHFADSLIIGSITLVPLRSKALFQWRLCLPGDVRFIRASFFRLFSADERKRRCRRRRNEETSHFELKKMVRDAGLEPANLSVLGPKPSAFANFASRARKKLRSVSFQEIQLRLLSKSPYAVSSFQGARTAGRLYKYSSASAHIQTGNTKKTTKDACEVFFSGFAPQNVDDPPRNARSP